MKECVRKLFLPSFSNLETYSPPLKKQRTARRPVLDEITGSQEVQDVRRQELHNVFNTSLHRPLKRCSDDVVAVAKHSTSGKLTDLQIATHMDREIPHAEFLEMVAIASNFHALLCAA